MAQFNKLKQTGIVFAYIQEFEELKTLMKETNKVFTDEYFMESFIGGLKEEVGKLVTLQEPASLFSATQLALKSEDIVQLLTKGQKLTPKAAPTPVHPYVRTEGGTNKLKLPPPIKRLAPEEMRLRRKKNLHFNYDETFHSGHKCKKLYLILGNDNDEDKEEKGYTLNH